MLVGHGTHSVGCAVSQVEQLARWHVHSNTPATCGLRHPYVRLDLRFDLVVIDGHNTARVEDPAHWVAFEK
jgi:hypothetical protein